MAAPDFRALIQQKEAELHQINEFRITSLETAVSQRVRLPSNRPPPPHPAPNRRAPRPPFSAGRGGP
jgi:hypothetical protein